jgi:hypothetical protein
LHNSAIAGAIESQPKVANFGNYLEMIIGKFFSPLLRLTMAKLFNKYLYSIINLSVILPQSGNCGGCNYGAERAWGGKGGTAVPPPKSDLFYPNLLVKQKNE